MNMMQNFNPDWVSPPFRTVYDILIEKDIRVTTFNDLMGWSQDMVTCVAFFEDKVSIDVELANRLADSLGGSSTFWLRRQNQYNEYRKELGYVL